jgi:hypothetical protein
MNGFEIIYTDIQVGTKHGSAGVARRDEQFAASTALFEFPRERVFSSTTAQEKNVHGCHVRRISAHLPNLTEASARKNKLPYFRPLNQTDY